MSKRRRNSNYDLQEREDDDHVTQEQYQRLRQRRLAEQTPISLNKMSLRLRLEAYYTLIAPDTVSNRREWLHRYDQIYDRYGGSYEGERKLAAKLAKKYGSMVQLKVATPLPPDCDVVDNQTSTDNTSDNNPAGGNHGNINEEFEWYSLRFKGTEEDGSGDVNFSSADFDPHAALVSFTEAEVLRLNQLLLEDTGTATIFDNVEKCTGLLPEGDPLRRMDGQYGRMTRPGTNSKILRETGRQKPESSSLHAFDDIGRALGGPGSRAPGTLGTGEGPFSTLLKMQHKRITVVIRYVNAIRGTLTGTLVAFDKHFNMILKNVDEVYSPRPIRQSEDERSHPLSNVEREVDRRRRLVMASGDRFEDHPSGSENDTPVFASWNVRQRHMKQLLVRGDIIVSVHEANAGKGQQEYRRSRYSAKKSTASEPERLMIRRGTKNEGSDKQG